MTTVANGALNPQLQALIERKNKIEAESAALDAEITAAFQTAPQNLEPSFALHQNGFHDLDIFQEQASPCNPSYTVPMSSQELSVSVFILL